MLRWSPLLFALALLVLPVAAAETDEGDPFLVWFHPDGAGGSYVVVHEECHVGESSSSDPGPVDVGVYSSRASSRAALSNDPFICTGGRRIPMGVFPCDYVPPGTIC